MEKILPIDMLHHYEIKLQILMEDIKGLDYRLKSVEHILENVWQGENAELAREKILEILKRISGIEENLYDSEKILKEMENQYFSESAFEE